jgi:serine/threonine-protein kinase HipA
VLFNVLVGNRDDHLRNHGFIREPSGWRLSQAFDVNPCLSKAEHALTLDGRSATPSVEVAMATAELYRLTTPQAQAVLAQVRKALADWRDEAERNGLARSEVQRMETVIQA